MTAAEMMRRRLAEVDPAVFEAIDRSGYNGWVGCEYKPRGRTEDGLAWARDWGVGR